MAVNTTKSTYTGNANDEVYFSIVSYIGVLAEYQTGWKKEVNMVAWNGNPPKFDVRDWSPDHERMSRGITLHEEEARRLAEHLSRRFRGGARMVHQPAPRVEAAPQAEVAPASASEIVAEAAATAAAASAAEGAALVQETEEAVSEALELAEESASESAEAECDEDNEEMETEAELEEEEAEEMAEEMAEAEE